MTTDQKQEPQAQLLSALRAAEAVIEDVTDTLRFIDGEPVTAFTDSEEIERVYLLMTGVLGGFTTLSAFSLDTVSLWEGCQPGRALAYVALTICLSLAAIVLALHLFRVVLA